MSHQLIIPRSKGTYILVLELPSAARIRVGSLGIIDFDSGTYLYVGSAHGPGGLHARIMRHLRRRKRLFWHIDYFLRYAKILAVYIIESPKKLECRIARRLIAEGVPFVSGFGSSDCRCKSHLFRTADPQIIDEILRKLCLNYSLIDIR